MSHVLLTTEQAQQIEEAFENAESVAASINAGKHHVIQIDDEKCFWQREEWVRWAIDEVLPEIREALSAIRAARAQEQAEQEPVSLHKVVEEHIADLRACVPTLRQYPEMASMTREVIKAANELEAALKSEQAEQEPVGYFLPPIDESDVWEEAIDQNCPTAVPLYAAPVQSVSAKPLCWAHWKSPDYAEDPAFLVTVTEKPIGWQTQSANWFPLYTAPVRTKDLTVSELDAIIEKHYDDEMDLKAMILDGIAADWMKNK